MLKPFIGRLPSARRSVEADFARIYYEGMQSDHWWSHGRNELVRVLLSRATITGNTVLDLGAGSNSLFPSSFDVVKLDVVKPPGKLGRFVLGSATALPFKDGAFEAVGAFDLIEHVQEEHSLISEVGRVLRPNGFIIATVPAHQWLWSVHDVRAGHVRRYSSNSLRQLFESSGFTVDWLGYFYGFLILPAIVRKLLRLKGGVRQPRNLINRLMSTVSSRSVASSLESPRPGLSLGILARAPGSGAN